MNKLDEEKLVLVYREAVKVVRKAERTGQNQSDTVNELEKIVRKAVDDEN